MSTWKVTCALKAHSMVAIHIKNAVLRGSNEFVLNWIYPGRKRVVDVLHSIRKKKHRLDGSGWLWHWWWGWRLPCLVSGYKVQAGQLVDQSVQCELQLLNMDSLVFFNNLLDLDPFAESILRKLTCKNHFCIFVVRAVTGNMHSKNLSHPRTMDMA